MSYTIVNTEHNEDHSTYATEAEAEAAMHEMTHVSECMDGRTEVRATTAIYKYRVRNDTTGNWIEQE